MAVNASGCFILVMNEYLMGHNKICAHLHYSICKALSIETTDKWCTHTHTHTHNHMPKPVYEQGDVTVVCSQAAHKDREVTAHRNHTEGIKHAH
jgi:hypothetical protein